MKNLAFAGIVFALFPCCVALPCAAQTTAAPPPRDAAAVKVIEASLGALGGDSYQQSPRFHCSVQQTIVGPHAAPAGQARMALQKLTPTTDHAFVRTYTTKDDDSTKGLRIIAAKWNAHWRQVHSNPTYQLSQMVNDPQYSLHLVNTGDKTSHEVVSTYYADGNAHTETTTWWNFSASTKEPVSVRYALRDPAHGGKTAYETLEFSEFATYKGFSAPRSYRLHRISGEIAVVTNRAVDCSAFSKE